MPDSEPCVFCGGKQRHSMTSTSFGAAPSFQEWTCTQCKSNYRKDDRGQETWRRSGHPLSFKDQGHA